MRRALLETPASRARVACACACLAGILATATAGCANGSSTSGDDLAGDPAIALSDPGAKLPELGSNVRTPGDEPVVSIPLAASTTNHLAPPSPFATTTCKTGAFCEDFEEPAPATRWRNAVITGGALDFPGPSASLGAHALRAVTSGAGGAAYLTRDGGAVGGQWVGVLELALRVDALPVSAVGGPELAVVDAAGSTTRIGLSIGPDGIALAQHFESCAGSACSARSDLVSNVAMAGEWRHLVVAVETYGTTSPPFGRIEVIVDGGDLLVLPLTVTLSDGEVEARAGITSGDTAPATARVDDVTFYAHGP
jgi:hypothetical protein